MAPGGKTVQFSQLRLSRGDSAFVTSGPLASLAPHVFKSPLDSVLALSQVTAGILPSAADRSFHSQAVHQSKGLRLEHQFSRSQFRMLKREISREKWGLGEKTGLEITEEDSSFVTPIRFASSGERVFNTPQEGLLSLVSTSIWRSSSPRFSCSVLVGALGFCANTLVKKDSGVFG